MTPKNLGMIFLFGALVYSASNAQPNPTGEQNSSQQSPTDSAANSTNETKQSGKAQIETDPSIPAPASPKSSQAVPIESDWHGRAEKWFTSPDKKERRKAMRQFTRALRKPCRFCHTSDFKGYTDRLLISQQMMAMTVEHGVECKDCHAGKDGFTKMGQISQKMWQLVHKKKVFCENCHVPQRQFQELTAEGKLFKESGH